MRSLIFIFFFLNLQIANAAIFVSDYLNLKKPLGGTPERSEVEFKMAFLVDSGTLIKPLAKEIQSRLAKLVESDQFNLSKKLKKKYRVDAGFRSFIFKDTYFDTVDFDIYHANADYRLRYRWPHPDRYLGHLFLPFIKFFYPNRCEIQMKHNYQYDNRYSVVRAFESRFEFRKESRPFSEGVKVPPPPWKPSQYKKYMQSGIWKDYKILPTNRLISVLQSKNRLKGDRLDLKPMIEVVTTRYRTHLLLKSPWGSGPNPEQAFIITLDRSEFKANEFNPKSNLSGKVLLEIEIEMERNITTEMHNLMNLERSQITKDLGENSEFFTAKKFSEDSFLLLQKDLLVLRENIAKIVQDYLKLTPLKTLYKYARFVQLLNGVQQ